jgi:hypothetical protein
MFSIIFGGEGGSRVVKDVTQQAMRGHGFFFLIMKRLDDFMV